MNLNIHSFRDNLLTVRSLFHSTNLQREDRAQLRRGLKRQRTHPRRGDPSFGGAEPKNLQNAQTDKGGRKTQRKK